jgi:uncharacterized damage-inducible protein DinB
MNRLASYGIPALFFALALSATAQQPPKPSPYRQISGHFANINQQVLDMAEDFPESKYAYSLKPEMRTFGALIVHIASGNVFATKRGRGEKVKWDEMDPKDYPTKASIVALLKKTVDESTAVLKSLPEESFTQSVEPWTSVIEHSAEHYGLLVAYYRANGLVPPASRPKK